MTQSRAESILLGMVVEREERLPQVIFHRAGDEIRELFLEARKENKDLKIAYLLRCLSASLDILACRSI